MKTKTRIEISTKKDKVYVQFYFADTETLIHTYIFNVWDTFRLDDMYINMINNTVSDFT